MNKDGAGAPLEALLGAYRFGEVGRCVNSVTHDVNNALGAILAYAELAGMEAGQTAETHRMLGEIIAQTRRSSELLSNLTDIARPRRRDVRDVAPGDLMRRALALRKHDFSTARVKVEESLPDDLPVVRVDLPAVQRAIIFLIVNAVEAVQDEEQRLVRCGAVASGEHVVFHFWNSGPVISEADTARIYEPFFTTKGPERLGLGLYAAREAARMHGGDLTYDPATGFQLSVSIEPVES